MTWAFYIASAVSVAAAALALTRASAVHALLYLVVSLLGVAVVFLALGAPFVAALEVIIYAGAIVVLFVFAVMVLGLGPRSVIVERARIGPRVWIGPAILALILTVELVYVSTATTDAISGRAVPPAQVGLSLLGPYLVGVELASLLLLAGLVAAYHLGRRGRGGER